MELLPERIITIIFLRFGGSLTPGALGHCPDSPLLWTDNSVMIEKRKQYYLMVENSLQIHIYSM